MNKKKEIVEMSTEEKIDFIVNSSKRFIICIVLLFGFCWFVGLVNFFEMFVLILLSIIADSLINIFCGMGIVNTTISKLGDKK